MSAHSSKTLLFKQQTSIISNQLMTFAKESISDIIATNRLTIFMLACDGVGKAQNLNCYFTPPIIYRRCIHMLHSRKLARKK